MDKVALKIKSDQMEAVLKAVMELSQRIKFEAKILSNSISDEIENFDELSNIILTKLDKSANKVVFERLKDK